MSEFIGRFHPLLVHLPIGILLIALLLQWLSRSEKYTVSHGVLKLLWALGAGFAALSCITGYLLSIHDAYDETAVALHMWSGIAVAALSLFLLAKVAARQYDVLYKSGAALLLILITITGHFGGSLTHGADYLSLAHLTATNDSAVFKPIANVQEALVYSDVVKPILQTKCYSCHGPQKQKAGLRLDDSARLIQGSEDGVVLVAGNAAESELIKSLLLPREDKMHMPPKAKPQLTKHQIALLHWWIENGAPFTGRVRELQQPENLKPALASLQQEEPKKTELNVVPTEPIAPADTGALKALRRCGVQVLPVAQGSNYLAANFVTASHAGDSVVAFLLPLRTHLVSLKLGSTGISDAALKTVGQCPNLYTLALNHTAITDAGMGFLKSLKSLQALNLVGTGITASGVLQLQHLPALKRVYLYHTAATATNWPQLQKAFPHTYLDSGGYLVPTLPGDTTRLNMPAAQ